MCTAWCRTGGPRIERRRFVRNSIHGGMTTQMALASQSPPVEHPYESDRPHGMLAEMTDDTSRILASNLLDEADLAIEGSLRPHTLEEYIGQREVKANLSVLLAAARGRGEAADHVLLYGPPGLGKTTLATIIARELGVNIRYTSGPAVERPGDLAAILTALDERDVLFIDEIHRLSRTVEEILYPAMEDYALDVMIGKGPSARSLRLNLKAFTVVGATTRAGRISGPLRDRFGATYRLDFYDDEGLDSTDRKLLAAIVQKFGSGPVGVQALAAVLSEEVETIEDVYEPFLLRLAFLDRTPQGRIATEAARQHLAGLGFW